MRRLAAAAALATGLAALAALPAASAQDECSPADPCTWLVDLDADGLHGLEDAPRWAFTLGDWFVLNATNFDDAPHTLALDGHAAVRLAVPAVDAAETAPFQFTQAGTFLLRDDAGHTGTVVVSAADVNDAAAGAPGTTSRQAPAPAALGLALGLLALGLLALAAARPRP